MIQVSIDLFCINIVKGKSKLCINTEPTIQIFIHRSHR